jgi:2-polyprenyl-3-methyl-5-hydroxy-6-metoxy-1,4-benzoquinol methylase
LRIKDALSLYAGAPLLTRAFLRGRVALSDLDFIERQVPRTGAVLDVGCGYGLFANLMALRSPQRRVTGIDPVAGRIGAARAAAAGRNNIEFIQGDIYALGDRPPFDVITIVDVLYLLPREEQLAVLAECRRRLRPGGRLIWKTQERRPLWEFAITYLQETVATGISLTHGKSRLTFLSRRDSLAILSEAGFSDNRVVEMRTRRPYPDVIFSSTRTS